jgi:aminoglycoside phosphotransferase (APT) family kinase protein
VREVALTAARLWAAGVDGDCVAGWTLERAAAGANGVVYRVERGGELLAAKVSAVDERDRGGREWAALRALRRAGLAVAPEPFHLEREPSGLPVTVLVEEWIDGKRVEVPPAELADVLAGVHRVEPDGCPDAVLGVGPVQVLGDLRRRAEGLDATGVERVAAAAANAVGATAPRRPGLLHVDGNVDNLVATADGLRILDWENAGTGDPCFDVADFCVHPSAPALPAGLPERHAEALGHPELARRTRAYVSLLVAWWVVLLRRELASPRPRLAGTRAPSVAEREALLERYEAWAGG